MTTWSIASIAPARKGLELGEHHWHAARRLGRGGQRLEVCSPHRVDRQAAPGEPSVGVVQIVHGEGQHRRALAMLGQSLAHTVARDPFADRSDDLERDVRKPEPRPHRAASGLGAPRLPAEQSFVAGDGRVEIPDSEYDMVEVGDHAMALSGSSTAALRLRYCAALRTGSPRLDFRCAAGVSIPFSAQKSARAKAQLRSER
jgi:hypothetical protein